MSTALIVFRPACLAIRRAATDCSRIYVKAIPSSLSTKSAPIEAPVASCAMRLIAAFGRLDSAML